MDVIVTSRRGNMESEIRNRPSFANLLVRMVQGDRIVAESDAMASMSSSITLRTRWNGGFLMALVRRLFGRESLFVNEFSTASRGELVLTQPWPGDIECIDLKGQTLFDQLVGRVGFQHQRVVDARHLVARELDIDDGADRLDDVSGGRGHGYLELIL